MAESLETLAIRGEDAKHLLANPMLQGAFEGVRDYLIAKAEGSDPDNKDRAQAVVLSLKLLAQIKAEIERHVQTGGAAKIQIALLEKKSLKERLFQR